MTIFEVELSTNQHIKISIIHTVILMSVVLIIRTVEGDFSHHIPSIAYLPTTLQTHVSSKEIARISIDIISDHSRSLISTSNRLSTFKINTPSHHSTFTLVKSEGMIISQTNNTNKIEHSIFLIFQKNVCQVHQSIHIAREHVISIITKVLWVCITDFPLCTTHLWMQTCCNTQSK